MYLRRVRAGISGHRWVLEGTRNGTTGPVGDGCRCPRDCSRVSEGTAALWIPTSAAPRQRPDQEPCYNVEAERDGIRSGEVLHQLVVDLAGDVAPGTREWRDQPAYAGHASEAVLGEEVPERAAEDGEGEDSENDGRMGREA